MPSPSLKWRYPMIMHPAEGKGFFHGLHLLNAGLKGRFFFSGPLIRGEDGSVAQEPCPPFPVFINATVWRKSCTHFSQNVCKSLDLKFGSGPHPRRVQNVTCKIAQRPYPHRAILPGETQPLSGLDGIDAGVGHRYGAGTNLWLYGVANFKSSGFNVSIGRTLVPHNGPS